MADSKHCPPHYCDNQGLCHYCGMLMEPDWYEHYAGERHVDDARPPRKQARARRRSEAKE